MTRLAFENAEFYETLDKRPPRLERFQDKLNAADKLIRSLSLGCLDADAQIAVRDFVKNRIKESPDIAAEALLRDQFQKGHLFVESQRSLLQAVSDCSALFDNNDERCINPASFKWIANDPALLELREMQLLYAFVVFSAHYDAIKARLIANKTYETELEACRLQIRQCALALNKLKRQGADEQLHVLYEINMADVEDKKKAKAAAFIRAIEKFFSDFMWIISSFNMRRLYTVWGKILLGLGFVAMHADAAAKSMGETAFITNPLSVVIYIFRGSVAVWGWLRNTYSTTYEDEGVDEEERRAVHWDARKYTILNDWIWWPANFMSAYGYLIVGMALYGVVGDASTTLLLFMDLALTRKGAAEMAKAHEVTMAGFNKSLFDIFERITKIKGITDKETTDCIARLSKDNPEKGIEDLNALVQKQYVTGDTSYNKSLNAFIQQFRLLNESRILCEKKRTIEKDNTDWDVWYALGLFIAFSLVCGFFLAQILGPGMVPDAADKLMNIGGSIMCLLFTIGHRSMQSDVEIKGLQETEESKKNKFDEKMDLFRGLKKEYEISLTEPNSARSILINNRMKLLYLDILQLGASTGYQHDLIEYKKVKFRHDSMLRLLVPVIFFVLFLTMPLPGGLFVASAMDFWCIFAGLLVATAITYKVLDDQYKPLETVWKRFSEAGLPEMDDKEYDEFYNKVTPLVEHEISEDFLLNEIVGKRSTQYEGLLFQPKKAPAPVPPVRKNNSSSFLLGDIFNLNRKDTATGSNEEEKGLLGKEN